MGELTPPKGFRPTIPVQVKFTVVMMQEGRCVRCGNKLGEWAETQFDHRPPIQMRTWDENTGDTTIPANDPAYIDAIHKDCHKAVTTGRRGESKLSKRGGDVSEIAKTKRLEKKRAEEENFRRKLLTSEPDDIESEPVKVLPKRKIPSRPFPKRKKDTQK